LVFEDAVIAFDLDGTLVESAPDLIGALNVVLAEHGLAPFPIVAARHLLGGGPRRMLERAFREAGASASEAELDALMARYVPLYLDHIADHSHVYEDVEMVLDGFRAAGARLLVCTNKRTDLSNALLDAVGLLDRFDAVVGPDRVSARKPDPAHLIEAIAIAGGWLDRALMVGDSAADVGAARRANVPVVAVSWGYTDIPPAELGADAVIDRFAELPAVARVLLKSRA
jgi:phosphoglycolate phosphatase